MKKIAVFYGTRFGGTVGIVKKIAEVLTEKGFDVLTQNTKEIDNYKEIFENEFSGIILGSGIQIGAWTSKMKKFITDYEQHIIKNTVKLGMFVSCGTAFTEEGTIKACTEYVDDFSMKLGLKPVITAAFGGVYDFSKKSKHGMIKKKLLQSIVKKETPGRFELNEINDFRNWDDIVAFAEKFAENM
ncbi:MAG: flavodoxin domain-containing protein [Promethearchaeota archaeon]